MGFPVNGHIWTAINNYGTSGNELISHIFAELIAGMLASSTQDKYWLRATESFQSQVRTVKPEIEEKHSIPHFHLVEDIEASRVLEYLTSLHSF